MYLWLFASMLVACEQVAPEGDPLQPVAVSEPSEPQVASENPSAEAGDDEAEEEVFSISSEELLAIASGEEVGDPAKEVAPVEEPKDAAEMAEEPAAIPVPTPQKTADGVAPTSSGWGDVIGKAWPVRLVTTVPNATPPRAILGLPDGREVVVNPGSMVPDMGLVVVAIAPNSAELARIAPAGDHATIETMTLRAQY